MSEKKNQEILQGSVYSRSQSITDLIKRLYEKQSKNGADTHQYNKLTKKLKALLYKIHKQFAEEDYDATQDPSQSKRSQNQQSIQLKMLNKQYENLYAAKLKEQNEKKASMKNLQQTKKKLKQVQEECKSLRKTQEQYKQFKSKSSLVESKIKEKQSKQSNDKNQQKLRFDDLINRIYENNKLIPDYNKFTTGIINKIIAAHKKLFKNEFVNPCDGCKQLQKELKKTKLTIQNQKQQLLKKTRESKIQQTKLNFDNNQLNLLKTKSYQIDNVKQNNQKLQKELHNQSFQIFTLKQSIEKLISENKQLKESNLKNSNKKEHIAVYIRKIYNNANEMDPSSIPDLEKCLHNIIEKIAAQFNSSQTSESIDIF